MAGSPYKQINRGVGIGIFDTKDSFAKLLRRLEIGIFDTKDSSKKTFA
jgi:hypothetical protein